MPYDLEKISIVLIVAAILLSGCQNAAPTAFENQNSASETASTEKTDSDREPASTEPPFTLNQWGPVSRAKTESGSRCAYAPYPRALPNETGQCVLDPGLRTETGPGGRNSYHFRIYNASARTHGAMVLAAQGLAGERYSAEMFVEISSRHRDGTVDLLLEAYEPTVWVIRGNTRAVRSVTAYGYHCAEVKGVSASRVTTSSYEEGGYSSASTAEIRAAGVRQSIDEGTCINRTFRAD